MDHSIPDLLSDPPPDVPMTTQAHDLGKELMRVDKRMLLSCIAHEEKMLDRKRRWLTGSPKTSRSTQKRLKRQNVYLPESSVRCDDVSFQAVTSCVKKSFRSFIVDQGRHHVVRDYLKLFDLGEMDGSVHTLVFLKTLSSALDDLNSDALCLAANIVSENNIRFERTRHGMKKVVEENILELIAQSKYGGHYEPVKQLSQIFRDPINYRKKHIKLLTPISLPLRSSIVKALERLDDLPTQTLIAMNRKLRNVTVIPQLPISLSCKREILIKRVRKKCHRILSTLDKETELPKSLAKALSVIRLSHKQITRRVDIPTSEFFPFPPEIEALQNDIIKAIWSLPKVAFDKLDTLRCLIDPDAKVSKKVFRTVLQKYLTEYLFECDEIDIPKPVLRILAFINSRSRLHVCAEEIIEEETEAILNISSQIRQILWDSFPDNNINQEFANAYVEGSGFDEDDCDIGIDEGEDCSNFCVSDYAQVCGPLSDDETERTEESRPVDLFLNGEDEPEWDQDAPLNGIRSCPGESSQCSAQTSSVDTNTTSGNRYLSIENICDETSIFAYKLIGRLMEELLQNDGKEINVVTRSYLRDGTSSALDFQGTGKDGSPSKDTEALIIQVVGELIPSLPKR